MEGETLLLGSWSPRREGSHAGPLRPSDRVPPLRWAPGQRRGVGRFPALRNCPHKREFGHLIRPSSRSCHEKLQWDFAEITAPGRGTDISCHFNILAFLAWQTSAGSLYLEVRD